MTVDFSKFGDWNAKKAAYLLTVAHELGMKTGGYGELGLNQNSGNVYLWLEDYDFCIYMPISCKLEKAGVWVMWTNPNSGEEIEKTLDEFDGLQSIEDWARDLYEKAESEE